MPAGQHREAVGAVPRTTRLSIIEAGLDRAVILCLARSESFVFQALSLPGGIFYETQSIRPLNRQFSHLACSNIHNTTSIFIVTISALIKKFRPISRLKSWALPRIQRTDNNAIFSRVEFSNSFVHVRTHTYDKLAKRKYNVLSCRITPDSLSFPKVQKLTRNIMINIYCKQFNLHKYLVGTQ